MHRADGDALQPQHLVVELGEHPANLAVLPLAEHDPQPRPVALRLDAADALGLDLAVRQPDAVEQLLEVVRGRLAGDEYQVGLLDLVPRVHQGVGEFAVVGHQQHPLARLVEAADGVDALLDVRDQVGREGPSGGVVVGAEVAGRLVNHPVDGLLGPHRLVVHRDLLQDGIDLRAEVGDDLAVELDAAGGDQGVAVPPGADAGVREKLVEAFHASTVARNRHS
jgi:hypothetical protein